MLLIIFVQSGLAQRAPFVRLYDDMNHKIAKGKLWAVEDTSLIILSNGVKYTFRYSQIEIIKMKRAFGSATSKTALIGAVPMAILGAVSADPEAAFVGYSAGEGILAGLVVGAAAGAVVGLVIDAATKRPEFKISRNLEKWRTVKPRLEAYLGVEKSEHGN